MSFSEERPADAAGDRDVVSAWIVALLLALGLALVPAVESAVTEGVQLIARLH